MPLSTTATVMCWPLVRSHTLLKSSARCAHGSLVRCVRPRCDRQFADGSGMPGTGAGGPGGAACCVGGATGCPVGGLAGRDVVGVGDGVAAAVLPSAAVARPAAPTGPARIVRGASAEIAKPEASAAPANRLIPGLPERCAALRAQL